MTPEDQNDGPPPHPRHLDDDKKLEVWRALRSKADPKFPFHEWYVGALAAVASTDESNPDRLAHAGNGLREILEKLPGDLETEITDRNILRQSRSAMAAAIAQARHEYGAGWAGEITEKLATALQTVDSYLELPDTPTRAERIFSGLSKFDPMMHALPSERQRQKRQLYQRISKKLEQFTHHRCRPDDKEFRDCLTQTEDLILDLLAPITADDHDELLAITAKGSTVTEVEIGRALHLVGRRGANFAFFFENVSDAVWLLPLETAGYFKQPPGITPAGDGSVTFQFWWPLLFLRRVAAQVPERVVEILLKMDRTNNPRVLDGILQIAADLPADCSICLEGKIRDYINQPYHV